MREGVQGLAWLAEQGKQRATKFLPSVRNSFTIPNLLVQDALEYRGVP